MVRMKRISGGILFLSFVWSGAVVMSAGGGPARFPDEAYRKIKSVVENGMGTLGAMNFLVKGVAWEDKEKFSFYFNLVGNIKMRMEALQFMLEIERAHAANSQSAPNAWAVLARYAEKTKNDYLEGILDDFYDHSDLLDDKKKKDALNSLVKIESGLLEHCDLYLGEAHEALDVLLKNLTAFSLSGFHSSDLVSHHCLAADLDELDR
jgi:hypothetical protein